MLLLGLIAAALVLSMGALTALNRSKPVARQGLIGAWLEKRRARQAPAGPGRSSTAFIRHAAMAFKAQGGVMRDVLGKLGTFSARQLRLEAKAQRRMPAVGDARERTKTSQATERDLVTRIAKDAPDTLGYHSPWPARLAGVALFAGGCLLNGNTYADFEPSRQDAITSALKEIDVSPAWALGAFQMLGFTLLAYAIAGCLAYALAPRRGLYTGREDGDSAQRIVYGQFSPRVYAAFALLFTLFALAVAYAVARLRLHGSLLDVAASAGVPASGAVGTLAGGVAPATGQPDKTAVFMVLALLELTATVAVFVFLEPALTRTVRGVRTQTNRDLKRAQRLVGKADRARVGGAVAGIKAKGALLDGVVRGWLPKLDALELDAVHAEANADVTFNPDERVLKAPENVLRTPEPLALPNTTPVPYPEDGADVDVSTGVLRRAGHAAEDYKTLEPSQPNGRRKPVWK